MDFFGRLTFGYASGTSIAANASSNGGYLGEHSYFAFTSMVQKMLRVQRWQDVRILGDAMPLWFPPCRAQQLSVRFVLGIPLGFSCEKVAQRCLALFLQPARPLEAHP
jgi:hypothetical protein